MAYNKKKLFKESKELIEKYRCTFIEDIVDLLPCCKGTFYKHFPIDSKEYEDLLKMIDKNKVLTKIKLRTDWYKSGNPTTQIMLYRLCANPEEIKKMSINYSENKTELSIEQPLFGDEDDEEG